MSDRLVPPALFTETCIATLQPGDRAFHGMLYPGLYPSAFDQQLHADLLEGKPVQIQGEFFDACRALADRRVRLEWLRVIPGEDMFGYTQADRDAIYAGAAAVAQVTKADMRVVDYRFALAKLAHHDINDSLGLYATYLRGISEHSPKASFWRFDNVLDEPQTVDIMHYTGSRFDGHTLFDVPVPDEYVAYTDFWRNLYEHHAMPVTTLFNES